MIHRIIFFILWSAPINATNKLQYPLRILHTTKSFNVAFVLAQTVMLTKYERLVNLIYSVSMKPSTVCWMFVLEGNKPIYTYCLKQNMNVRTSERITTKLHVHNVNVRDIWVRGNGNWMCMRLFEESILNMNINGIL